MQVAGAPSNYKRCELQKEREKHGTPVGPPFAQFLHWRNSQSLIESHRTHVSIPSGLPGVGYGVGTLFKKFRSLRGPRRTPGPLFQALEDPAALPDEQTMATSNGTQTSTRHRRVQSAVSGGYTKQDGTILRHDPGISVDYSR